MFECDVASGELLFGHEAMLAYDFFVDDVSEDVEFDFESWSEWVFDVLLLTAFNDEFRFFDS